MPAPAPYESYQKQAVRTMTPGELIVALYDRSIAHIQAAIRDIRLKNTGGAHLHIRKTRDIVCYLESILAPGVPVADTLRLYYGKIRKQLFTANIKKDPAALEDALFAMRQIRDVWKHAECEARAGAAARRNAP